MEDPMKPCIARKSRTAIEIYDSMIDRLTNRLSHPM